MILLSSVRRSLFATDKDRAAFLQQLVSAIREILQTEKGLEYQVPCVHVYRYVWSLFTPTLSLTITCPSSSSPINTTNTLTQRQENYHEFCRLLGRLKANYQLCELVRTEGVKA